MIVSNLMRPTVKAQDEAFQIIRKGFATSYPASDNATAFMQDERFAWSTPVNALAGSGEGERPKTFKIR